MALRSVTGYLEAYIPKKPVEGGQNAPPQRKKKRKPKKFKGAMKHNLNWVNAFAEAGCSNLLPKRKEQLVECFETLKARLTELEEKSKQETILMHEAARKKAENPIVTAADFTTKDGKPIAKEK